jgi:hypothetical protein
MSERIKITPKTTDDDFIEPIEPIIKKKVVRKKKDDETNNIIKVKEIIKEVKVENPETLEKLKMIENELSRVKQESEQIKSFNNNLVNKVKKLHNEGAESYEYKSFSSKKDIFNLLKK